MWRCHCGETNLNSRTHCQVCSGARSTHEMSEPHPKRRERRKTVYVGFFGMGMGDERVREEPSERVMSEHELDAYFARSRRTLRLQWILYAALAAGVLFVLLWQVIRRP